MRESWGVSEERLHALNEEIRAYQVEQTPEYWYTNDDNRDVNPNDLGTAKKAENLNQIYNNITVWLRVMPNVSPWYIKTRNAENLKPKMAIGAIYCTEVNNDVGEREISV